MSQSELLIHAIKALADTTTEHMLTGSLVSSMQGEPRATHDIDLVVAASTDSIVAFLERFPPEEYYYDVDSAKEEIRRGGMFNILSMTGDKVDIWALTDSEFDQSRFARKLQVEFLGLDVNISSPEDTILMKLLWSKQGGGSEKQLFDAAKVYDMQRDILDEEYLRAWIQKLGLEGQVAAMQRTL